MAHDVFISYSHKDKSIADAICARLEQDGVRCWYAPRDIAPGADWAESIIESIEHSKVMVLVFTDFSNASRQVLREINNAVRTGAVIIPFRLTQTPPSGGMRYYLSTVHWLDALDGTLEHNLAQLSTLVRSILTNTPLPESADVRDDADQPPKRRGWLLPAGLTAALLTAALLFWWGGRSRTENAPEPAAVQTEATAEASPSPEPEVTAEPTAAAAAEAPGAENTARPAEKPDEPAGSPGVSSPGAENYLYEIKRDTVILKKYAGSGESAVTVPAIIDGFPVAEIDEECFYRHEEIVSVVLPDTVTKLGYEAFYGCLNLTEINFPASLREIGEWCFAHTGFVDVVIPENVTRLGKGAFYSSLSLVSVTLPEQITEIGEDTFRLCYRLRRVTVAAAEPNIHYDAFNDNSKVTIVGIPGSYSEKYANALGLSFEPIGS